MTTQHHAAQVPSQAMTRQCLRFKVAICRGKGAQKSAGDSMRQPENWEVPESHCLTDFIQSLFLYVRLHGVAEKIQKLGMTWRAFPYFSITSTCSKTLSLVPGRDKPPYPRGVQRTPMRYSPLANLFLLCFPPVGTMASTGAGWDVLEMDGNGKLWADLQTKISAGNLRVYNGKPSFS
jgi:hypothetical protein